MGPASTTFQSLTKLSATRSIAPAKNKKISTKAKEDDDSPPAKKAPKSFSFGGIGGNKKPVATKKTTGKEKTTNEPKATTKAKKPAFSFGLPKTEPKATSTTTTDKKTTKKN